VFDWTWTAGCFGTTKISPMDFDGVVERNGNFLLFETKNIGVPIPRGQMRTLEAMHRLGCFTILLIFGKTEPETIEVWYPNCNAKKIFHGIDEAKQIVASWYQYADSHHFQAGGNLGAEPI
jgi:hypothetical protein